MKRKTIIAICFAIVIGIVLFMPIPERINTTLQGSRLADTSIDDSVNISIKGWRLIHLFRPNEIKGALTITPYEFIFLIAIKLVAGLALFYGVVKLFKTKKFRDIISKI